MDSEENSNKSNHLEHPDSPQNGDSFVVIESPNEEETLVPHDSSEENEKLEEKPKIPIQKNEEPEEKPPSTPVSQKNTNLSNKLTDNGLNITKVQDINILLLGETGVGKSTFINSIANYLHFKSFKQAAKAEELLVLIPSLMTVTDENGDDIQIQIGSDTNEFQEVGAAGTQDVRTYVFPIGEGKTRIRLIDSPGMGDPRGIEQDDTNCENILAYLSQLKELHAICFLMKPITTRRTVYFEYCVRQILSRLEKSASKNIIFIFTNARGTDYTPGDTLPILRKVINEIKAQPPHVDIPLRKENTFSLDNEAFKILAALKKNVDMGEISENYIKSWVNSSRECWRLITYIVGDDTHTPLTPHQLQNTISVNEARRLILQLSQPLADISQLISDNLRVLERHKRNLQMENQSLEELKRKMYIPVINLKVTQLNKPVTVCTSPKCAEVMKVGELNKWHYRQRCHDPCYLNNVAKEYVGDPALVGCWAMNRTMNCRVCSCQYTVHMHVYYFTEPYDDRIVDNVVKDNIEHKEAAVDEVQRLIGEMEQRKKELEEEQYIVIKSTAQFAHFLQNNAITPFNDSYKAYVEYLIMREKSLGRASDKQMIANLERLLRQYEEIKRAFDKSLELSKSMNVNETASSPVTAQTVLNTAQELYRLKHNGKKIREIVEKQKRSKRSEYDGSCEYIHPKTSGCWNRRQNEKSNYKKSKKEKKANNNKTLLKRCQEAFTQLLFPSPVAPGYFSRDEQQMQYSSAVKNFSPGPPPPYSSCERFPIDDNRHYGHSAPDGEYLDEATACNRYQKQRKNADTSPSHSKYQETSSVEKNKLDPAVEQLIQKTCNDFALQFESKMNKNMEEINEKMSKIGAMLLGLSSVMPLLVANQTSAEKKDSSDSSEDSD